MPRWEYCAIVGMWKDLRNPRPSYPAIWYFTAQGTQVEAISGDEAAIVGQTIARLGDQGWEMVGAGDTANLDTTGGRISHSIYFKRQKP